MSSFWDCWQVANLFHCKNLGRTFGEHGRLELKVTGKEIEDGAVENKGIGWKPYCYVRGSGMGRGGDS